jgi:cold shock protein
MRVRARPSSPLPLSAGGGILHRVPYTARALKAAYFNWARRQGFSPAATQAMWLRKKLGPERALSPERLERMRAAANISAPDSRRRKPAEATNRPGLSREIAQAPKLLNRGGRPMMTCSYCHAPHRVDRERRHLARCPKRQGVRTSISPHASSATPEQSAWTGRTMHFQDAPVGTECGALRPRSVDVTKVTCRKCLASVRRKADIKRFARLSLPIGVLQPQGKVGQNQLGWVHHYNAQKGYGFIRSHGGGDVFVHRSALVGRATELAPGMTVAFDVIASSRGLRAANVRGRVRESNSQIIVLSPRSARMGGSRKSEALTNDTESWREPGPE